MIRLSMVDMFLPPAVCILDTFTCSLSILIFFLVFNIRYILCSSEISFFVSPVSCLCFLLCKLILFLFPPIVLGFSFLFLFCSILHRVAKLCIISHPPYFIHSDFQFFLATASLFFIPLIAFLISVAVIISRSAFPSAIISWNLLLSTFVLFLLPPYSQLVLFSKIIYSILNAFLMFYLCFLVFGFDYVVFGVGFVLSFQVSFLPPIFYAIIYIIFYFFWKLWDFCFSVLFYFVCDVFFQDLHSF